MIKKINDLLSEFIKNNDHEKEVSEEDEQELKKLASLLKVANDKINKDELLDNDLSLNYAYFTEIITVVTSVFSGNYEEKIAPNDFFLLNSLGNSINLLIKEFKWRTIELDKKNHFFSKVTEVISDVIFVYDIDKKIITYKNRSDSNIAKLMEKPLFSEGGLIHNIYSDDIFVVEKTITDYSKLKDEKISSVEFRIKDSLGNLSWFLMKSSAFLTDKEGNTTEVLGTIINITKLRLTEIKKREEEKRFRKLSEASNDAVIVINEKREIISWNKGAGKMFKYEEAKILGSNIDLIIPEDYKSGNKKSIYKTSGSKKNFNGIPRDMEALDKDGKEFPIEINFSRWRVDGNKYFGAIIRDITKRKENENKLIKSNNEKEMLLKEVHHRVKNNLQIINGLLDLQLRKVDSAEARMALQESKSRIRSISLVHEQLYQHEHLAEINFTNYLQILYDEIALANSSNETEVSIIFKCKDVLSININKSIPLGLIVNELLTNIYKHAFKLKNKGEIIITLNKTGIKDFELSINDNGVGLPLDFDEKKSKSLGYKIISSLVSQIDGTLTQVNNEKGLTTKINFKTTDL